MSTIKSSSEDLTLNADGSNEVKFQINAVEKASINSSGLFTSTTIDATKLIGNLPAISGASLTSLPAHTGNVAFPATQVASADANTLDDYEEGTWTPVLTGATTTTYTAQEGDYTKVGRMMICHGIIVVNSLGDGSTSSISGLPFTASSTATATSAGGMYVNLSASLAVSPVEFSGFVTNSSTSITINGRTAGANTTSSQAIFGNNARIDFTIIYYV